MAQFRSSAREGSFSNNQLEQPDAVSKIQTEGNRQIAGMKHKNNHKIYNVEVIKP